MTPRLLPLHSKVSAGGKRRGGGVTAHGALILPAPRRGDNLRTKLASEEWGEGVLPAEGEQGAQDGKEPDSGSVICRTSTKRKLRPL